jgi:hypothetical protein
MVELYLHSPMSSWSGAKLIKHKDNPTIYLYPKGRDHLGDLGVEYNILIDLK